MSEHPPPRDIGHPTLEGLDPIRISDIFMGDRAPVLVVLTGCHVGQRMRLDGPVTIGQDPACELVLSDEGIAWEHARIEFSAERWHLVDLSGSGGTEVNGEPCTARALEPDDQILVGGTIIRFEEHDAVEQAFDRAVQERINVDELTGLASRRRFDAELSSVLRAADRGGGTLSLLVLDVDRLKPINDAYGHLVGANAIGHVGRIIGELVQAPALCCRLGGDEFAIALPNADAALAFELGEAIRAALHERPFVVSGQSVWLSVSGGVATCPGHGTQALHLLRAADDALYRAKSAGGDEIAIASPKTEPP